MKEIEDDTVEWKNNPCSWIGRVNIVKLSILPKAKIPMAFSTEIEQTILKFTWNHKKIPNRAILRKNKADSIILPNFVPQSTFCSVWRHFGCHSLGVRLEGAVCY